MQRPFQPHDLGVGVFGHRIHLFTGPLGWDVAEQKHPQQPGAAKRRSSRGRVTQRRFEITAIPESWCNTGRFEANGVLRTWTRTLPRRGLPESSCPNEFHMAFTAAGSAASAPFGDPMQRFGGMASSQPCSPSHPVLPSRSSLWMSIVSRHGGQVAGRT